MLTYLLTSIRNHAAFWQWCFLIIQVIMIFFSLVTRLDVTSKDTATRWSSGRYLYSLTSMVILLITFCLQFTDDIIPVVMITAPLHIVMPTVDVAVMACLGHFIYTAAIAYCAIFIFVPKLQNCLTGRLLFTVNLLFFLLVNSVCLPKYLLPRWQLIDERLRQSEGLINALWIDGDVPINEHDLHQRKPDETRFLDRYSRWCYFYDGEDQDFTLILQIEGRWVAYQRDVKKKFVSLENPEWKKLIRACQQRRW